MKPGQLGVSKKMNLSRRWTDILFTDGRASGATFRDYTVFVGSKHFTVTQPSDIRFLEYFYERCIAPEAEAPTPHHKLEDVLGKLAHWMEQPI
jgi:hypothetical protein